ncbi:MAG: hypothetical protein ACAH83_19720 [Alphaproteobacteria bacterium]
MRHSFIHFLLFCFILLPGAARAGEPIGSVRDMTGTATIRHAGEAEAHAVAKDAPLFMQDVIEAGDGAHMTMTFADGTELTLSGRGKLTVDEYIFDGKAPEKNKSVFTLLDTAFSYTGGLIDKNAQSKINLEHGSIGIRGTKVMSAFAGGGNWVYLDSGKITIDNDAGQVIVNPGEGTSINSKTQAPDAPYKWSAEEIAWLQHVIDDPAARISATMASNNESMPLGRSRPASQMAAAEAPAPVRALEGLQRGRADLDDEAAKKEADSKSSNVMEAAPAAQPAQMPASSADAGAAGGGAPAAASAPAAPPVSSEPVPAELAEAKAKMPARAKAEAAIEAPAEAARAAPQDIISPQKLSVSLLAAKMSQDGAGVMRIDAPRPVVITLATEDVSAQKLEDTIVTFRASMKAKNLKGSAYLEMWVHLPGAKGGSFFSRGLDNQLAKEEDWQEFQAPFLLKKGQVPDKVTLNLVINGTGTVWIRDLRLQK